MCLAGTPSSFKLFHLVWFSLTPFAKPFVQREILMQSRMTLFAVGSILCLFPTSVFSETLRQITVQVLDEDGKPAERAEVRARYLANVQQRNKPYQVPMELAPSQTTDANGQCELVLRDVSWSLAAVRVSRPEITIDEAIELYDKAPKQPSKREAYERKVDDRLNRYSTAWQKLSPTVDASQPITLKLEKAIKVIGRIRVNGMPLPKAFGTVASPKTEVNKLFPVASPVLTDQEGRFSYYAIPGKLNQVKIVVERASGKRHLNLSEVPAEPTSAGRMYEIDTVASDYVVE